MNIKERINKILSRKTSLEDFFKNKIIEKTEQKLYSSLSDVWVKDLTNKDEVKNRISEYLNSDVNITSVEYGWVSLPPHRVSGWADTTWPVGEEEVNNVWKIDIEKNGKKISLAAIHSDLAILQSDEDIKFTPYPKGYEFDDRRQSVPIKSRHTGGAWNEEEVTEAVPHFQYDGDKIKLIGATEITGLSHHGNGGASFNETERKLMTAEQFNKLRAEFKQRQAAKIASEQKQ